MWINKKLLLYYHVFDGTIVLLLVGFAFDPPAAVARISLRLTRLSIPPFVSCISYVPSGYFLRILPPRHFLVAPVVVGLSRSIEFTCPSLLLSSVFNRCPCN